MPLRGTAMHRMRRRPNRAYCDAVHPFRQTATAAVCLPRLLLAAAVFCGFSMVPPAGGAVEPSVTSEASTVPVETPSPGGAEAPASEAATAVSEASPQDPLAMSLDAIRDLLEQRSERRADLKILRKELAKPREDTDTAQLSASINEIEASIEDVNRQISALATGVSEVEFDLDSNLKIDLKAEAEQLLQLDRGLDGAVVAVDEGHAAAAGDVQALRGTPVEAAPLVVVEPVEQLNARQLVLSGAGLRGDGLQVGFDPREAQPTQQRGRGIVGPALEPRRGQQLGGALRVVLVAELRQRQRQALGLVVGERVDTAGDVAGAHPPGVERSLQRLAAEHRVGVAPGARGGRVVGAPVAEQPRSDDHAGRGGEREQQGGTQEAPPAG